jgi:hypothetical protein
MLRANQDRLLEEQQQRDRFNLNSIIEDSDTDPTDQLTFRHEDSDASRVGSVVSRADVNSMRSHDEARRSSKVDGHHPSNAGSKGGLNVSNVSALSGQRSVSHDGGDRDDASDEDFTTNTHHSQSSNSLYRASSAPAVVGTRPVDSKDIDPERPITVGTDAAAVLRNNNSNNNNNNSNSPTKIKSKTALSLLAVKHNTLMDDSSSSIDNSALAMSGNNEASRLEELSHDDRFMREGGDSDQAEESELIDDDAELQAFHHRRLTAGYNAASGDRDDDDDDAAEEEQSIEEDISPSMISDSRRVIKQQLFSGNDTTFLSDDNPTASSSHHYSDDFECPEHEVDFSPSSSAEREREEVDEVKDRESDIAMTAGLDDATRVVHRRETDALSAVAGMHTGTGSTYFPRPYADDVAFWSSLKSMPHSLDVLEGITRRRKSSDGSYSRGLRDRLEYLHSEYFSYWQQGSSSSPAEGPIDSEALSTMMSDAMEVCKRAIEYSIAVVNISLEQPKEPSFLPDYFPETGAATTGGIESLLLLFQQGSMQWLQLAITVCAAFCAFVPSFISICEHLAARVCDKTAVVKAGFVAVLASCAGVIGSAIYLPQDDELHSSKPFQSAINRCYNWAISANADMEAQVYGLSVSDKWCLMALLAELLKTANRKSDVVGSVLLQTLQSLNTLLSHASLSTFNMIVAQQIPSLVCDSAIDKVHALYKHAIAEATAGKHTGSGSNRVSVMKGLLLHLAHAYSLLLSPTTTPSWGIHCPIPCGIDSTYITSSGSSQDHSSEFDAHSSQVMLRLRVCRGMTDKLCQDDDGRDRSGLHKLLLLTCELFSEGNNNTTLYRSLSDQLLAFTRTDLINTLLHLTELNGRSFCAAISSYDDGRMIDCLMKQLKAISISSGYDHPQDEDAVRSSMCLLVLTRLLASQTLTADAVVSITRIVVTSTEQMSRRQAIAPGDHRHHDYSCIGDSWSKQMYACFDWLAEVTRTLMRVSDTQNELTQETQRQLLALVDRLTSDERFVKYLIRVLEAFSKHPHPSGGDQLPPPSCYPRVQFMHLAQYGYPSVVFVWNSLSSSSTASVMGGEFGVRLHGCLDGLCELISHVSSLCHANHAVAFDIHSEPVTHLVETLCCAISQEVRTMLDGHHPHL